MSEPPRWLVPLSDTTLGQDEASAAADVVRSGWLSQGARVAEFEQAFAGLIGVPHAIAVANCTLGLELALTACGVGPGDEVIVPALTFVATANAARRVGARPVFADVRSEDDLCLDPDDVARKLTRHTRAICPVHFAGYVADMAQLEPIAARAGAALLEDCAHAPGARQGARMAGALGEIGAFSFFANKNLTTGEGGMLTTRDATLAARLRAARSHGMSTTTWDRHRGHAFTYDVETVGTNARMDEIHAAIGLIQLRKLSAGNRARQRHVAHYRQRLSGIAGLGLPFATRDPDESAHHLMVVLLPERCDRESVMSALRTAGVQTSIHYPPTHRFRAYSDPTIQLLRTDAIAPRLLTLPLHPGLRSEQLDLVCDALIDAIR